MKFCPRFVKLAAPGAMVVGLHCINTHHHYCHHHMFNKKLAECNYVQHPSIHLSIHLFWMGGWVGGWMDGWMDGHCT